MMVVYFRKDMQDCHTKCERNANEKWKFPCYLQHFVKKCIEIWVLVKQSTFALEISI